MTIIPQLRFPEFLEKDGWEIKEVGEIFQVTRGYVLSMTLVKEVPSEEYPYPVFSSQTKNNGLAGYYNEYLYEDAITWTTDGANAGDVNYRDGKFYCTNVCGVLLNEEGFANPCIAELINSVSKKHVSYVGNPKLMNGVMSKIQIPVPSIPEQQKIASCLSSLDELLAAHNEKLDALKDHKKGLLQNLFPSADETVPKIRFPEFEGDGEWVEKKLGKVYSFLVTNSFSRAKLNYEDGEVKNIHYGDIHTKFSTLFDISREEVPYINPDVSTDKIREECYCKEGDMIFADASEDLNDVGKSIEIVNLNGERLVSGLHTLMARQIEKTLEIGFGGYLFKSDWIKKQIQREAQGAKVLGISTGRISNIKISFPRNPIEQQKIASCLSAVDELITAQQEKIEQLQQHKKGLMQGLFPKIES
ncbi:MAG: restriction endonuclease subunit S [Flavobacterium sp.]|nr:MAG: restriction endonuclease subunit S [Flavobacterium sp.]